MTNRTLAIEYIRAIILIILLISTIIKSIFFDIDYVLLAMIALLGLAAASGIDFTPSHISTSEKNQEK